MAGSSLDSPSRGDTKTVDAYPHEAFPDEAGKGNYGSAPGVVEDVADIVDHKAERALCRRFDFRILPMLAVMCESVLCAGLVAPY